MVGASETIQDIGSLTIATTTAAVEGGPDDDMAVTDSSFAPSAEFLSTIAAIAVVIKARTLGEAHDLIPTVAIPALAYGITVPEGVPDRITALATKANEVKCSTRVHPPVSIAVSITDTVAFVIMATSAPVACEQPIDFLITLQTISTYAPSVSEKSTVGSFTSTVAMSTSAGSATMGRGKFVNSAISAVDKASALAWNCTSGHSTFPVVSASGATSAAATLVCLAIKEGAVEHSFKGISTPTAATANDAAS
jgi:hypothetical protein